MQDILEQESIESLKRRLAETERELEIALEALSRFMADAEPEVDHHINHWLEGD